MKAVEENMNIMRQVIEDIKKTQKELLEMGNTRSET